MSINPDALKSKGGTSAKAEVLAMRMKKKKRLRNGNRFIFLFFLPVGENGINTKVDSEALKHVLTA